MDAMLPPGRLFHVSYAVPHLETAMAELGGLFEVEWASVAERSATMHRPSVGTFEWEYRFVYSTTGPPHVELVESLTADAWTAEETFLHHVGVWARDLDADSARLERLGFPCWGHGVGEDGAMARFAFHTTPEGSLVELIAPAMRPGFERWVNGAEFGS